MKQIRVACAEVTNLPLDKFTEFQGDLKELSEADYLKCRKEIEETGFAFRPHVWKNGTKYLLVDGHQRIRTLRQMEKDGWDFTSVQIPCVLVEAKSMAEAKRRVLQGTSQYGKMTGQGLYQFMHEAQLDYAEVDSSFRLPDIDMKSFGQEYFDLGPSAPEMGGLLRSFLVPPFSVLDARQGYWKDRKDAWLGLGIRSELGRDSELIGKEDSKSCYGKNPAGKNADGSLAYDEGVGCTSIFDPVLCELAYLWFTAPGMTVLDPFAGGSVRGIVASRLGRQYRGIELREEQVRANRAQAKELCKTVPPVWYCDSSVNVDKIIKDKEPIDFIFSCPPYADLEVYSDDPRDLSNMEYAKFRKFYCEIIKKSVALLKPNRFACFVVGEVREKGSNGFYRNFVGDTIAAFEAAGARYYNEAILVTNVGSLQLRAGKIFRGSRKLGKTHQNVLVFCKGDAKQASAACGEVQVQEFAQESSS